MSAPEGALRSHLHHDLRPFRPPRHRIPCPASVRRFAGNCGPRTGDPTQAKDLGTSNMFESATIDPQLVTQPHTVCVLATQSERPADSDPRTRNTRRRWLLLASLITVALATTTASLSGTVRHQLLLSFTRQPDSFTELYFSSPGSLPSTFVAGRPLGIRFGLTNDSDSARTYVYIVEVTAHDRATIAEHSGALHVGAHGAVVTSLHVMVPAGTSSLSVHLTGQPDVIRLLLHSGPTHAG
jgi:hypothetical protein